MGTIKNNILGFAILVMGLMAVSWFLMSRYVEIGECASIVYYQPLSVIERLIIVGIGVIASFVFFLLRGNKPKNPTKIIVSIYILLIVTISFYGNTILGSRTVDWPHTYKVQPIPAALTNQQK